MICLISGRVGSGKSTAIARIADMLGVRRCAGLLAGEILENDRRVGFSSLGLHSRRQIILAHHNIDRIYAIEDFGVDLKAFEELCCAEFASAMSDEKIPFIIVDEIGRMQLLSKQFEQLLIQIAESDKTLIATICYDDDLDFAREFKQREDAKLFILNEENRDHIPLKIVEEVCRDDDIYMGKLALARKYKNEKERYVFEEGRIILNSTHGTRTIKRSEGIWHCDCDYYKETGTCSHILSLLLPDE